MLLSKSSGKMSLFLIAIVHSLLFQFAYSQSCTPETGVKLTFYGYPDGSSDTTSFGCSGTSPTGQGNNGGTAGGSGTYSDPETFATAMDNTNFKECEIVYIPYLQKYFRYNDHCQQCNTDFANGLIHIDLWIGSDTNGGQPQTTCEDDFGAVPDQTIIRSPPTNLPVKSGALWDGSTCSNSPGQGLVFPNPDTSGLCSGGSSSSPGNSPAPGPSSPAASPSPPATTTPATAPITPPKQDAVVQQQPPPASSSPPATSAAPAPVVHNYQEEKVKEPAPASTTSTTSTTPPPTPPTPTTLITKVATPSSSPPPSTNNAGKFGSPGMTYSQAMAASYAGCASWNGCLGDPCQSYDNCAGEWICVAGKCTDNLHD